MIDENCSILFLSPTYGGKVHDKKIADSSEIVLPSGVVLLQDLGFTGYSLLNVEIIQPIKRSKKRSLSLFDKVVNRMISSSRVYVEHVIGSVKRCRVLSEKCRLRGEEKHDFVMEIGCGLHNLRVVCSPWKKMPDPGNLKVI